MPLAALLAARLRIRGRPLGGTHSIGDDALMEWMTSTTLLRRLERSDDEAWAELVTRFRDPILRWGGERGLEDAKAQDLAQEALMTLVTQLREGRYERGKGRLGAWLFGIVKMTHLGSLSRKRPASFSELGENEQEPDLPVEDEGWERSWRRQLFALCLDRAKEEFSAEHVEAFVLTTLHELSANEAAERLGLSRNAVFVAKHRVVKRLRELEAEIDEIEL